MTTPSPLSSEEMLGRLRMMAVETHGLMARSLQRTAKWAKADQERYPRADFNAASNAEMVTRYAKDLAALTEVIALLKVLTNPDFMGLARTDIWHALIKTSVSGCDKHTAPDAIKALLAAHKALQEKGAETGD